MIDASEAQARLTQSKFPRVTEDHIKSKITNVHFIEQDNTTVCIITMKNGFKFLGHSTPADPRNYDRDIGEHYAYENAFKQIWSHEGYLLREQLSASTN